ncbi:MAG: hypothetical protein KDD20_01695 [Mangrovimonas sp.]|nr:hypothetical protein [Mangrovimonas sp.]MCB0437431.1 hypothetical protein [Mangrovimonas sp.]
MRTNNEKIKNVIISVYFILIVLAILLATVFSAFKHLSPNPFLTFVILAVVFVGLFLLVHRISKYFEYDSDGPQVVIINRGLLLADYLNYREQKAEFARQNLTAFKFKNWLLFKQLTVYYVSNHGHKRKDTFNVTLVPKKKRKYIRQSLSKMIKDNKKNTTI